MKRVAIITSSDMGYQGRREDLSGPAIKEIVEREGYQVVSMDILPDVQRKSKTIQFPHLYFFFISMWAPLSLYAQVPTTHALPHLF